MKKKCGEKAKLCYMDTHSFRVYIKTGDIYVDIAKDAETKFDTSNYELELPFSKGKKKVIGLMKDALSGKLMTEFTALIPKTCNYLIDDGDENKKATGTKKCVIKRKLKFEYCFEATQVKNKIKKFSKK